MGKLNISGRRPEGSELMALYIDEPQTDKIFKMHKITPRRYEGATGDGTLDLIGFDVDASDTSKLKFWLINQRPPVGVDGKYLDAAKVGDNVTVEVFEYAKGQRTMSHVKTISDSNIYSGNGLALLGDGSFMLTNDHSAKGTSNSPQVEE